MEENIILIGMPSSGKTTIGKILASELGFEFVDTDVLIRSTHRKELPDIVRIYGRDYFLKAQEDEITGLDRKRSVIATGGGVIYSDRAMKHLSGGGTVFYLDSDISDIKSRVDSSRRLSGKKGQDIEELFRERRPLYEKFCDYSINCRNKDPFEIAREIAYIWKTGRPV